jgi:hypothetical protein
MITSLFKWTVRQAADGAGLLTRHGVRLTRAIASTAFGPPRRGRTPEPASGAADRERPKAAQAASERGRGESAIRSAVPPSRPPVPGRDAVPARTPDPHHALNAPVGEPDPTEWPDPYDRREDPRDSGAAEEASVGEAPHTQTGATSTSAPHPSEDPEAFPWEGPKRERLGE